MDDAAEIDAADQLGVIANSVVDRSRRMPGNRRHKKRQEQNSSSDDDDDDEGENDDDDIEEEIRDVMRSSKKQKHVNTIKEIKTHPRIPESARKHHSRGQMTSKKGRRDGKN